MKQTYRCKTPPTIMYNKTHYPLYEYKWQYNGVAPFEEIAEWCNKNIKGYSLIKFETIWFSRQQDYAWFLLRWS